MVGQVLAQLLTLTSQDTPKCPAFFVHVLINTHIPVLKKQWVDTAKLPHLVHAAHQHVRATDQHEGDQTDPMQHHPVTIITSIS